MSRGLYQELRVMRVSPRAPEILSYELLLIFINIYSWFYRESHTKYTSDSNKIVI